MREDQAAKEERITPIKKGQATFIAPLQPLTLAPFPSWGIQQELVVKDLPAAKILKDADYARYKFLAANYVDF